MTMQSKYIFIYTFLGYMTNSIYLFSKLSSNFSLFVGKVEPFITIAFHSNLIQIIFTTLWKIKDQSYFLST